MDNFPFTPTNTNESSFNKPSSPQPEGLKTEYELSLELNPFQELDSIPYLPYQLLAPYHEPSSPQPEDFQCDDLSLDNTLPLSEELRPYCSAYSENTDTQAELNSFREYDQADSSSPQPEDFQYNYLSLDNTLPLSEELRPYCSAYSENTDTQAELNSFREYDQADSSSPQPEDFQYNYLSLDNTLPLSEELRPYCSAYSENTDTQAELNSFREYDQADSSSPQPEDFQYNYLSLDNTLPLSEKELENCDSAFWQDPDIQAEFNKLENSIEPKTPNPDSCTAPTTNMPIAAPKPEGLETKDEPELNKLENSIEPKTPNPDSCTAPTTNMPIAATQPEGLETKDELSIAVRILLGQRDQADPTLTQPSDNQFPGNRENTMRAPITYEADPEHYIRTCLYALCEPLLMYWKSPISEHITISILKTPPYKQFEGNVEQYLKTLCRPPSSSDGQDNLQSTIYKEKWDEFYNGARIAINELLQSSHTTVKLLQNNSIKVLEALDHHSNNTIHPIYSKINKLCELPLYHTQQEALTLLFLAVDKHYKQRGRKSITRIGDAHRKDNPVDNFKVCTVIPELKDLFSGKQQYINDLENKIKELITYIDQNTHSSNCVVIDKNAMINPKYVTMIKDIIIGKITQDPDYQCDMPPIKLSVKTNENQWDTDQDYCLKHTHAYPLVITCLLDESNTLTKDQRDRATNLLNAACKQINEQFTATLNRILVSTSQKKHTSKKKKELKQPESQATMAPIPVEPRTVEPIPVEPRTVPQMFIPQMHMVPMFVPQMFVPQMPKPPNRKRENTSPGLSSETSPSKQQRSTLFPSSPLPLLPPTPAVINKLMFEAYTSNNNFDI